MNHANFDVLVTGAAGFIGFHLSRNLLGKGLKVLGIDNFDPYYDLKLKESRAEVLLSDNNFDLLRSDITQADALEVALNGCEFPIIVHLAAQAGVRHSLEDPEKYLSTNILGSFNILELAERRAISHLLLASTSSVYGANKDASFHEADRTDHQISLYAATKKSMEVMAHSHSHLFKIPTTVFRFFSVYGPWGRPDMALFKFVKAAVNGEAIDLYNHGNMRRDFTYVEDLAESISRLMAAAPCRPNETVADDSLSHVAPYRVVNIGNAQSIELMALVEAIEDKLGITIRRNMLGMQPGDVCSTLSDTRILHSLCGSLPSTALRDGVSEFVDWYLAYYGSGK